VENLEMLMPSEQPEPVPGPVWLSVGFVSQPQQKISVTLYISVICKPLAGVCKGN